MNMKKITTTLVIFLMIAVIFSVSGQADESTAKLSLIIKAPSSVIEGQHFLVQITDNYNRTVDYAWVTFIYPGGRQSGYTHNGSIWFTAPIYNKSESKIPGLITAEKKGYNSASVPIDIIRMEEVLLISAPSSVREGEHFLVRVTDFAGQPIDGALVTFRYFGGQQAGFTYNGSIGFTAPVYNESSNWTRGTITAEKEGYLPAQVDIEILLDEEVLEISAPDSVLEGFRFSVRVTDGTGQPIDGALVAFRVLDGENGTYGNYTEFEYTHNGTAWFTAPLVDETILGELEASKDGYVSARADILIIDRVDQLFIESPEFVLEGTGFFVAVHDGNGMPINGAQVSLIVPGSGNLTAYTVNGTAWFLAPLVDHSTLSTLYASKEGYFSAEKEITIIDRSEQLVIRAPASVLEGQRFSVMVTDGNGRPIDGARVSLFVPGCKNQTLITRNGSVSFVAPLVDHDTLGHLYASKEGYRSATKDIMILNKK